MIEEFFAIILTIELRRSERRGLNILHVDGGILVLRTGYPTLQNALKVVGKQEAVF